MGSLEGTRSDLAECVAPRTMPAPCPHDARTMPARCPHHARTMPAPCPHDARTMPARSIELPGCSCASRCRAPLDADPMPEDAPHAWMRIRCRFQAIAAKGLRAMCGGYRYRALLGQARVPRLYVLVPAVLFFLFFFFPSPLAACHSSARCAELACWRAAGCAGCGDHAAQVERGRHEPRGRQGALFRRSEISQVSKDPTAA